MAARTGPHGGEGRERGAPGCTSAPAGVARRPACGPQGGDPAADNRSVSGPSFRFRLERVRALRERREKLAQQELARSISRLSATRDRLQAAEAELARAQHEQRASVAGDRTAAGADLQLRQAFIERVEQQHRQRERDVSRDEAEVASRNAELTTAAGEREMLERLRTRRRSEHERETARRESRVLDEMASARSRRSVA